LSMERLPLTLPLPLLLIQWLFTSMSVGNLASGQSTIPRR
jgi:hypothetical protein